MRHKYKTLLSSYENIVSSREQEYEASRLKGIQQGLGQFYDTNEYTKFVARSRMEGARAFLQSSVFEAITDGNVFKELLALGINAVCKLMFYAGTRKVLIHPCWILSSMKTAIFTLGILGKSRFPMMMNSMPYFFSWILCPLRSQLITR
ncbi:hypothetical protein Salat_0620700 [Sesamum alatum]|uniref:Uncharacterized protein n=1 Tax=Sesamum alatum TaxID=300844 RepID=A0AAE1YQ91_9LAMI|nr:hypothetical protein Salat_0620700 [Sesamum alatum]